MNPQTNLATSKYKRDETATRSAGLENESTGRDWIESKVNYWFHPSQDLPLFLFASPSTPSLTHNYFPRGSKARTVPVIFIVWSGSNVKQWQDVLELPSREQSHQVFSTVRQLSVFSKLVSWVFHHSLLLKWWRVSSQMEVQKVKSMLGVYLVV
jgi:hypothetical protein